MTQSLRARFRTGAASAALSLTLSLSAVAAVSFVCLTPAFAATSLDATQSASLKSSLTLAIQNALGNSSAIQAAVQKALEDAVALYGEDAAGSITSAIITIAEAAGASQADIGTGLAQGAAKLSATAGEAVALAVFNEGKTPEVDAFVLQANTDGKTKLASIAGGKTTKDTDDTEDTSDTGGGGNNNGNNLTGGGNGPAAVAAAA
ncbi:MAG: hypothetical protein WDN08_06200 [Rhizomicrobium sp.]